MPFLKAFTTRPLATKTWYVCPKHGVLGQRHLLAFRVLGHLGPISEAAKCRVSPSEAPGCRPHECPNSSEGLARPPSSGPIRSAASDNTCYCNPGVFRLTRVQQEARKQSEEDDCLGCQPSHVAAGTPNPTLRAMWDVLWQSPGPAPKTFLV